MKATYTIPTFLTFQRGYKNYELSNHLGNVLVTISDKKLGVSSNGTTIVNFLADVRNSNDYYPFGMLEPGRTYTAANTYRYGFNGKEMDNEVKGQANQQDYGMRIYDPRVGRFLSIDPITSKFPHLTPYQFASDRPLDGIDLNGLEYATYRIYVDKNQRVTKISPPTLDYELKNNGNEGPGVKYVIYQVDEGNRPDEVRWSKNIYGIYQGGDNPKLPIVGQNYKNAWTDIRSLKPIDEADANAKQHDFDYDQLHLSGLDGILDEKSTKANEDYIKRADIIINKYKKHEKDDITGKPVTKKAKDAAEFGKKWFTRAEEMKRANQLKDDKIQKIPTQ